MNTANSGAVFFLGTRAHYQVLTPPESHAYDIENANASTETIYQNPSTDLWHDKTTDNFNYTPQHYATSDSDGVKRRLKKNRKQDGSSEMILNDNDDFHDVNEAKHCVDGDNNKSKPKRSRVSVAHLLALLARRRRTLRDHSPRVAANVCTFRNSCRCDECQSRYFECDESDEDYSISDDSEYSHYSQQYSQQYAASVDTFADVPVDAQREEQPVEEEEDDDDEVFIDSPPADTTSTEQLIAPPRAPTPPPALDDEGNALTLQMAAGAPLVFDMLLNHPLTCAIQ